MKYVIFITLLVGCTDAQWARVAALTKPHSVICYSGGKVIYSGKSTGTVKNEGHSDGYYFEDAKTKKLVSVSGQCVITIE